ncbi:hypothetical protein SEUCBS140593_010763, partial [Sporothrix eucalyptigena]
MALFFRHLRIGSILVSRVYLGSNRGQNKPISVAEYLFTRLHQLGVRSVHGVPGDFNLPALDYLPKANLAWVGNVNELNAGYAADGYARIKGIAALVTTCGVGELSAANAMAGAYAERVPIVHVVGYPSTRAQQRAAILHHTLGTGNFDVFRTMNASISCQATELEQPQAIARQIDKALSQCWINSQPVYLALPVDRTHSQVEGYRLHTPLDLNEAPNDAAAEEDAIAAILAQIYEAKRPAILVDVCAVRFRVLDDVLRMADIAEIPVFVTPMAKAAVDETSPRYRGVYAGQASHASIRDELESSDLILSIGALECDLNTGGFSHRLPTEKVICFHSTHTQLGHEIFSEVRMKGLLRTLNERLDETQLARKYTQPEEECSLHDVTDTLPRPDTITHAWLWPRIGTFLRSGDIVVSDTGVSAFGIWDTAFPTAVTALTQLLWASIGWSVGAAQGAALAARDSGHGRRTVLFVGDGALQLAAQELSTIVRHNLNVTIFCICNEGYTAERLLHHAGASYNDITLWKHKELLTAVS